MHPSPHVMRYLKITKFNENNIIHKNISNISKNIHESSTKEENKAEELFIELEQLAGKLWEIATVAK